MPALHPHLELLTAPGEGRPPSRPFEPAWKHCGLPSDQQLSSPNPIFVSLAGRTGGCLLEGLLGPPGNGRGRVLLVLAGALFPNRFELWDWTEWAAGLG